MGSNVGIGFVYSFKKAEIELNHIIEYLLFNNGEVIRYKFCKDENGTSWITAKEIGDLSSKELSEKIVGNYFGEIEISCKLFNRSIEKITLSVTVIDKENFGILVDIPEGELIREKGEVVCIERNIISFIKNIYKTSNYDYAFCDNEARIEYSLPEIERLESCPNSITVTPSAVSGGFKTSLTNWAIDGLTRRK